MGLSHYCRLSWLNDTDNFGTGIKIYPSQSDALAQPEF